jgi:hypothetical protein
MNTYCDDSGPAPIRKPASKGDFAVMTGSVNNAAVETSCELSCTFVDVLLMKSKMVYFFLAFAVLAQAMRRVGGSSLLRFRCTQIVIDHNPVS